MTTDEGLKVFQENVLSMFIATHSDLLHEALVYLYTNYTIMDYNGDRSNKCDKTWVTHMLSPVGLGTPGSGGTRRIN